MPAFETQEVNLVANPGQGFGLSIRGGVNGYAGNPMDPNDEGIFISQVGNPRTKTQR